MKYEKFNKHCFYKHKKVNLHCQYVHRIYGGWVVRTVINKFDFADEDIINEIWLELYKLFNNDDKLNLFEHIGVFKVTLDNVIKKIKLYLYRGGVKSDNINNSIKQSEELFTEIDIEEIDLINIIKQHLTQEEFEILYDFYFLDMTNEEMGAKYDKPKTTIRDRRIRIQKKLKEALLDDGYDLDDLLS